MRPVGPMLALAALLAAPAHAQDAPLDMQPSTSWTADFGDYYCALRREFAAGDATMFLEFARLAPGDEVRITLVSDTMAPSEEEPVIAFQPGDQAVQFDLFEQVRSDAGFGGYIVSDMLPSDLATQVSALSVSKGFAAPLVLATGPLEEAMEVMQTCTDGLVESWGLDAETQRTLGRQVGIDWDAYWVDDYFERAEEMAAERGLGVLRSQLLIDSDGRVTRCYAYQLPAAEREANPVCAYLTESARFRPARNALGRPTDSYLHLDVARAGAREYFREQGVRGDQTGVRFPPNDRSQ